MFRFRGFLKRTPTYAYSLDMARFENQFDEAQFKLDSIVMTQTVPYMPMITGTFINRTKAISASMAGSGWVCVAAPPYGRFLYEGKTMVSPTTGSTYARKDEKKVLVSQYAGRTQAKENLEYTKNFHSGVEAHWFEAAKRRYGKNWVSMTKRLAGGG